LATVGEPKWVQQNDIQTFDLQQAQGQMSGLRGNRQSWALLRQGTQSFNKNQLAQLPSV
jgi:hypothetical protein